MSQVSTSPRTKALALCLSLIHDELQRVERSLEAQLRSDIALIDEMVRQGCIAGGKRFRPMLLLLAARAVGNVTDRHIQLATAIEMIHAATLVHDDILDGASTRRHRPTINSQWGTQGAVLFGDFLFTHAFFLTSMAGDIFACQAIGRATNTVCEGELQQTASVGDYATTIEEYFDIIHKKTAALCGCATMIGAHVAGADRSGSKQWERVGYNLGIAFQVVDDILDVRGNESMCGKTLGTDLKTAKPTLPILLALSRETPAGRRHWLHVLNNRQPQFDDVAGWLVDHRAIDDSINRAKQLVEQALELAQTADPLVNRCFEELGRFLLRRVH